MVKLPGPPEFLNYIHKSNVGAKSMRLTPVIPGGLPLKKPFNVRLVHHDVF